MVENKDYFMRKWEDQIESEDVLKEGYCEAFFLLGCLKWQGRLNSLT